MKALGTSVSPWTLEAELPEAEERNEETRARVQALSAGQPGPLALSPLLLILMSLGQWFASPFPIPAALPWPATTQTRDC